MSATGGDDDGGGGGPPLGRWMRAVEALVRWALLMLLAAVVSAMAFFVYNSPPRGVRVNNLARRETQDLRDRFAEIAARFQRAYGPDMAAWWAGLLRGGDVSRVVPGVLERWRLAGITNEVLSTAFVEANDDTPGAPDDLATMFYMFPNREFPGDDRLHSALKTGGDVPPPMYDPNRDLAGDFVVWFSVEDFDPLQNVRRGDADADVSEYVANARCVEHFDLAAAMLPQFVETLHARNAFFSHIAIEDVPRTLKFLRDRAAAAAGEGEGEGGTGQDALGLDDPGSLPDLLLAYGVNRGNRACVLYVLDMLACAVDGVTRLLRAKVFAMVSGNAAFARQYAAAAAAAAERAINFRDASEDEVYDAVGAVPPPPTQAEAPNALQRLSRAVRAWEAVSVRAKELVGAGGLGDVLAVARFVADSKAAVRGVVDDVVAARAMGTGERVGAEWLAKEQALWLESVRMLEAAGRTGLVQALESLRAFRGDPDPEALAKAFDDYVNAVNAAVYVESYLPDAKRKWNVRHTNDLRSEHFYRNYFLDILDVYVAKNTYRTLPARDCTHCVEPWRGRLGDWYTHESVVECSRRFWQWRRFGPGTDIVRDSQRIVSNALRGVLSGCDMGGNFVSRALATEFDGKGFYGGTSNGQWIFSMWLADSSKVWLPDPGRWQHAVDTGDEDIDAIGTEELRAPWVWDGIVFRPDMVVFEDCPQGGTVIYSRFADEAGSHRYLSTTSTGGLTWDRTFRITTRTFSACKAGARLRAGLEVDGLGISNTSGQLSGPTQAEVNHDVDVVRTVEGFAPEPSGGKSRSRSRREEREEQREGFASEPPADYCVQPDGAGGGGGSGLWDSGAAGAISQHGLFQVLDVETPPDRMMLSSERFVSIVSYSPRDPDPRYANKRVVALGVFPGPDGNAVKPVLLDDNEENRSRSVIKLINQTVNTNGPVVIGSPAKHEKRGKVSYPYFLRHDGKTGYVGPKPNKWALWMMIGVIVAAVAVSVVTMGAAAPLAGALGATAAAAMATTVGTAAAWTAAGAAVLAGGTAIYEFNKLNKAAGVATDTGELIINKLDDASMNPFTHFDLRIMLALEKPGLCPEFQLVKYSDPNRVIGSKPPEPEGKATRPEFVVRDREGGGNRVLLLPADPKRYSPMITEYDKDNFQRKALPFHIFSINKSMFLVPNTDKKKDPPTWVKCDDTYNDNKQCTGYASYNEMDMLTGLKPVPDCFLPWYVYEMHIDDAIDE